MARWGSFDFESLKQLQKNLQALEGEAMDEFMLDQTNRQGASLLRRTKRATPVKSGHLRKEWKAEAVKKVGDSYEITIYNPVHYAPYVEFGHRQLRVVNSDLFGKVKSYGWVKGKFMLSNSTKLTESKMGRFLELQMIKFLKEGLK